MRASSGSWLVGAVRAVARVVIDLGQLEGDRGVADAGESRLARVKLGNCSLISYQLILRRSGLLFRPLKIRIEIHTSSAVLRLARAR